jgi:hypothetical protein
MPDVRSPGHSYEGDLKLYVSAIETLTHFRFESHLLE